MFQVSINILVEINILDIDSNRYERLSVTQHTQLLSSISVIMIMTFLYAVNFICTRMMFSDLGSNHILSLNLLSVS